MPPAAEEELSLLGWRRPQGGAAWEGEPPPLHVTLPDGTSAGRPHKQTLLLQLGKLGRDGSRVKVGAGGSAGKHLRFLDMPLSLQGLSVHSTSLPGKPSVAA